MRFVCIFVLLLKFLISCNDSTVTQYENDLTNKVPDFFQSEEISISSQDDIENSIEDTEYSEDTNHNIALACEEYYTTGSPAVCINSFESQCQVATSNPEKMFRWTLHIEEVDDNPPEMERRRDCINEFLRNNGIEQFYWYENNFDLLDVIGTYANLSNVLDYKIIDEFKISCHGDGYCNCESLTIDTCESNPFCFLRYGAKYDIENSCSMGKLPAGCYSEAVCAAVVSFAIDPEGYCWRFPHLCPIGDNGWEYLEQPNQSYEKCNYHDTLNMQSCE